MHAVLSSRIRARTVQDVQCRIHLSLRNRRIPTKTNTPVCFRLVTYIRLLRTNNLYFVSTSRKIYRTIFTKKKKKNHHFSPADERPTVVNVISSVVEVINAFKSRPESCVRWGFGNFKTFDGKIYSFQSDCTYTLIGDIKANSYHVQARFDRGAVSYINIYIVDNLYQIKKTGKCFFANRIRIPLRVTYNCFFFFFRFKPATYRW